MLAAIVVTVATAALAVSLPSVQAVATAPPTTAPSDPGPVATNDLLPANNNLGNCIGTAEQRQLR